MIEEIKYFLISLSENDFDFKQLDNCLKIGYNGIVVEEKSEEIVIYFNSEDPLLFEKSKYLNKVNTIKHFSDISLGMNYIKYLNKIIPDIKYELYHYFMFKLKEIVLNYKYLNFSIVSENTAIRCDLGKLDLDGKSLSYNFIFVANNNDSCKLTFYPEKPLWDEGKVCPKNNVDEIIHYIKALKVFDYDSIPLEEC